MMTAKHRIENNSGYDAEQDVEREAQARVVKKSGNRWSNQGADTLEKLLEASFAAYQQASMTAGAARFGVLEQVYETCLAAAANGQVKDLRALCRDKLGPAYRKNVHLVLTVLAAYGPLSRDKRSRWAGALRFAFLRDTAPEELVDFIKTNGGVDACDTALRKALKNETSNEAGKQDLGRVAKPTKRGVAEVSLMDDWDGASHEGKRIGKKKRHEVSAKGRAKPAAEMKKIVKQHPDERNATSPPTVPLMQEFAVTPEFALQQKNIAKKLAQMHKSGFLLIKAIVSKKGALTLQEASRDRARGKAASAKLKASKRSTRPRSWETEKRKAKSDSFALA